MYINNYELDENQLSIVKDNSKYLLVVAGAGSGKTLTILGKIKYLIEEKNIKPEEILCISFTNKASLNLKDKIKRELNKEVEVYTFHKLGLEILKDNNYEIADTDLLADIINNFFYQDIYNYPKLIKLVLKYFKEKDYDRVLNNKKDLTNLSNNITTFIKLFKCNNRDINDYKKYFKRIRLNLSYKKYKEESIFLILTLNIYLLYESYLKDNKEIDFDDMLIKATSYVKENGYNKKLKYIIIDEYQDTSFIRFNLIKEIINKTDASLLVVGDDYQSIYRFTGCDLDLFINFSKYFPTARIKRIENTYRNSKELINVAGSFIMKNKKQIKKRLKSDKSLFKPIKIIYYKDINKTIENIINSFNDKEDILILGRNNNDINILDNNLKKYFLTVHKSKGLEKGNVIIINLVDNVLGFPSKIKNEKILRLVSNNKEYYPYSEERRLFYVALTRTKNCVYLLVPYNKESIFIKELEKYYKKDIEILKN